MRQLLGPLLLAAMLAACGDPPSAFAPPESYSNPLLEPGLRGGVVVPAVEGIPDAGAAEALTASVIEGLRQAEIPALPEMQPDQATPGTTGTVTENAAGADTDATAQHYVLQGDVQQTPAAGRLRIEWRLLDIERAEVAHFATDHRATAAEWAEMPPSLRTEIASAAVRAVNRYLEESEGLPPEIESLPSVHIGGIEGVRDVDAAALRRSLEYHLEKAGVTVEQAVGDKGAMILGTIATTPSAGRPGGPPVETLHVTWTLLRPDGREIGILRQANDVPRGTLQRPWGDLGYLIAQAATPGIVELLQKAAQADAVRAGASKTDPTRIDAGQAEEGRPDTRSGRTAERTRTPRPAEPPAL